jgi:hypothetical protein
MTIKKKTHRGVGLLRFKVGNKLGGYFLLLNTLEKINEKLTQETMITPRTSISSSISNLLFYFLVKSGSSMNRAGTNLVLSPLFP